jgi:hypothetical protein
LLSDGLRLGHHPAAAHDGLDELQDQWHQPVPVDPGRQTQGLRMLLVRLHDLLLGVLLRLATLRLRLLRLGLICHVVTPRKTGANSPQRTEGTGRVAIAVHFDPCWKTGGGARKGRRSPAPGNHG